LKPPTGNYFLGVKAYYPSDMLTPLNTQAQVYSFVVKAGKPYFISLHSFDMFLNEESKTMRIECKILVLDANRNVYDRPLQVNVTVSYRSGQFFWPNFDSSKPLYSKLHDVSTPDLKPALISSVDIKNPIRGRIIDVDIFLRIQ